MELTYENMKTFIKRYCKDYSLYANDAETMHKMDEYWTPDFISTAYFHVKGEDYPLIHRSRKVFQEFLIYGHINVKDSLIPRDIVIDEKRKKAVVIFKIEKEYRISGEKIEIDGIGCYQLITDDENGIKIKSLDFFWNAPAEIKRQYVR